MGADLGTPFVVGTGDRKGRDGASPSSTQRHDDVREAETNRSVDDGFTPSRPLRSLVTLQRVSRLSPRLWTKPLSLRETYP